MNRLYLTLFALLLSLMVQAQLTKNVTVSVGGLTFAIITEEKSKVTNLIINGTIDARDFKTMRDELPALTSIDLSGATIASYQGTQGTIDTASVNYPVNTIPDHAFSTLVNIGKSSLNSIVFPSTLKSIGSTSFLNCSGITSLQIPAGVNTIGRSAFNGCTSIETITFSGTSKLDTIGIYAFRNCTALTSITIPKSVKIIMDGAFRNCTTLSSLNFESNSLLEKIGFYSFRENYKLASVTIPSSVKMIDYGAFMNCSILSSVNFEPNSALTTIGIYAFGLCPLLTSFEVLPTVTSIGNVAFLGSSALVTVDPTNPSYVSENGILYDKAKTRLMYCPNSINGNFTFPTTVKTVAVDAFYNCAGITSITFPDSLMVLEDWAFENCSGLKSSDLPKHISYLGEGCFYGCNALESVILPNSVSSIGSQSFSECKSLKNIYNFATTPIDLSKSADVFLNVNHSSCILNVPYKTSKLYSNANQWKDFSTISEMLPDSVDVTFMVDLQGWAVSDSGVHINGSFVNWSKHIAMTNIGRSVFVAKIRLPRGASIEYKFVNGGYLDWGNYEIPTGDCTTGDPHNRFLIVPDKDITLQLVCFNSCSECSATITNHVDIPKTSTSPEIDGVIDSVWYNTEAIAISKNYKNENPTVDAWWRAMWDDNGIFVLLNVKDNDYWPAWEVPLQPDFLYDWPNVFFDINKNLKDGGGPGNTPGHYEPAISFRQNDAGILQTKATSGNYVGCQYAYSVTGEDYAIEYFFPFEFFNDSTGKAMNKQSFLLLDSIGFDVYITDQDEGITTTRQRKVWQNDGAVDEAWANMDNSGRIKLVGEAPQPETVNVTFQVNMSPEEVTSSGVSLNGSFGNWANPVQMVKVSGNIYSATVPLQKGTTVEYKFVNGGGFDWDKYELLVGECAYGAPRNRWLVVPNKDSVLKIACFNTCRDYPAVKTNHVDIPKTTVAPSVDGAIDPAWATINPVAISKNYMQDMPTVDAWWKATWADSGLFVLVSVIDDSHWPSWKSGGEPWEFDQVEFYLDVNDTLKDGVGPQAIGSGHYQAYTHFTSNGYGVPVLNEPSDGQYPGGNYAYRHDGTGYIVERFFPFSNFIDKRGNRLTKNAFLSKSNIGFDVYITDQDSNITTTRQRKVWQNSGITNDAYYNMDDCGTITLIGDNPDSVNVTFRVNMQNQIVSGRGVHINGSWKNWSSDIAMAYDDSVFVKTLKLSVGDTVQYKFINGAAFDWGMYELLEGDCAYSPAKNRMVVVPAHNVTLDIACFGSCSPCSPNPINNGLLAYYPLNGNALDMSGYGNHGTIQGQTTFTNGALKEAALFRGSGTGDYIYVPKSNITNLSKVTVSAWVNFSSFDLNCWNQEEGIFSFSAVDSSNYFSLNVVRNEDVASNCRSASSFDFYGFSFIFAKDNHIETSRIYRPNQWHHVVGTYDGNVLSIYVDDQLAAQSGSIPGLNISKGAAMWINNHHFQEQNSNGRAGGMIDEVKLYNRALSAMGIDTLFKQVTVLNGSPVANAGTDQTVTEKTLVTLNGSASYDPDNQYLAFTWESPTGITLSDKTAISPTFTAPDVKTNTKYQFTLEVFDGLVHSFSDTVTITVQPEAVPETLNLPEGTLTNNSVSCFNALQSIVVAGGSSVVVIESGSSATFIAGQSIRFLPGFQAKSGSWMDAFITTNGTFCDGASGSIVQQPDDKSVTLGSSVVPSSNSSMAVKVYPNPSTGHFTIELQNAEGKATICLYNSLGVKVFQSVSNTMVNDIDLPNTEKGIYFMTINNGKNQITRKLIVR